MADAGNEYEGERSKNYHSRRLHQAGFPVQSDRQNEEIKEKAMIILSIKIEEMLKKLKLLTSPYHTPNIFNVFSDREQ